MKLIGNLIWVLFGGLLLAIEYAILGLIWCITIIGIPFGIQLFKCASLALWPFGREVRYKQQSSGCLSTGMNLIWILLGGLLLALEHGIIGLIFCITFIGIPFGKQHFKLAAIALTPFGREIASMKKIRRSVEAVQEQIDTPTESVGALDAQPDTNVINNEGAEELQITNEGGDNVSSLAANLNNLLQDSPIDKQKIYIGGGVLVAIIVCVALWFGLKGCSDDNVSIQLLQAQPAYWSKFVSPKSASTPIYEQPDISHILLKTDQSSILPVLDETQSFYKVYMGEGREGWVKKNQWKVIPFDPIKPDMLSDILLGWQRLACRSVTFNDGDLENLTLCYYRDFSSEGHLEIAILDNGRLVRPQYPSIDAVAINKRGFTITGSSESGKPRIEFGTNYQLKKDDLENYQEDLEQFLDFSKLSKRQIAEIWKAAQGDKPNMVTVSYYFPSQKAIRFYDINLNVYGQEADSNKGKAVEGNAGLSGFTYDVEGLYDSAAEITLYCLNVVTPTGEKVNTEIADGAVKLTLLAQGDYDGDGEREAVVYEWGGGNSVQPPYLVYYDKDEEVFKKAEGFDYISEDPEIKIEEWNEKTSFVTTVGLRRDRYVYSNHSLSLAERIVPDVGTRVATIPLSQLFKADGDDGVNRSIYIDIDGDGSTEKLIFYHDTSHASDWGNSMSLIKIEADNWSIPENEDESLGVSGNTFTFLASKNGVVPDILCDDAWLYKWSGEKYTRP